MLPKILAVISIFVILYLCAIFLFPDQADIYGSKNFNETIRMYKRESELDRNLDDSSSLIDKASDIARPYVDESKNLVQETTHTIQNVNTAIKEKGDQVKQAADAVQNAYTAAEDAKNKLNALTNYGTGK